MTKLWMCFLILPLESSFERGKQIVQNIKHIISHKLHPMKVQSIVENRSITRKDIYPVRKHVTGMRYSDSLLKKLRKILKIIK
ncbi:hypothetical protein J3U75_10575 [Snodgrassella sp. B3088]|uniref:hypothetical protein n=1 Tax=Snodgrassella sp. B3088 TaxID=2818038 RepID=UPI00226A0B89|nr:hypothetical protein [Snodgrassella sp. B3088]MCX8749795.1 hypothetical protein [Snodgrassella sp. B3088]